METLIIHANKDGINIVKGNTSNQVQYLMLHSALVTVAKDMSLDEIQSAINNLKETFNDA